MDAKYWSLTIYSTTGPRAQKEDAVKKSWRTLALLASLVMVVAASCAGTGDQGPEPYELEDDDSADESFDGLMGGGCNCQSFNVGFDNDNDTTTDDDTGDDDATPFTCTGPVYHISVFTEDGAYCFTDEAETCLNGFDQFPIVRGWTDTWGATLEVNQNLDCQAVEDGISPGGLLEIIMYDEDEEECNLFSVIYNNYYNEPIEPKCSL